MPQLIDFIMHIDQHLISIVNQFDSMTYLILFALIFIETGVVILPFLPGDSLLFAASALAANQAFNLNFGMFLVTFFVAAVLGDSLNYEIGKHTGLLVSRNSFFLGVLESRKVGQSGNIFQ